MPGRQSHGRPLSGGGGSGGGAQKDNKRTQQRSKARSGRKALDAFAIASKTHGERTKQTPRNRELDAGLGSAGHKHSRGEGGGDEDGGDDDRPRKMRRRDAQEGGGEEEDEEDEAIEYGSDSSGNEWRVGASKGDEDDSEIESDDAFGESDEERFQAYAFGGGGGKKKSKKRKGRNAQDGEEDSDDSDEGLDDDVDDADGASLGSDAIDLAQVLDQLSSDDDDDDDENGSSGSSESSDDMEGFPSSETEENGVQDFVAKFSGVQDNDEEFTLAPGKKKIDMKDLGLFNIKDPELKKSLKLMSKEAKTSKPQKLQAPLERRHQAQLDRSVAYGKTNETLDRWTETVKRNRRADHLVFPLPQTETGLARHDNSEIQPLNRKDPANELEAAVLGIMEQSGLGPSAEKVAEIPLNDEQTAISRQQLQEQWREKKRQRELKSREEARAKRIKKIKSKAYHRVHRKQRERDEMRAREALEEEGLVDSEEDREAQDRQRAMERMGARHRDSKWAKMSSKGGRAAWDDDVRMGIAEMARRDDELRKRVEGKSGSGRYGRDGEEEDDGASDFSGDEDDEVDERARLNRELDFLHSKPDGEPVSSLMKMAFMQKAEARKKQANDDMVAQIRKDLRLDGEESEEESDHEPEEVGRKSFGNKNAASASMLNGKDKKRKKADKAWDTAEGKATDQTATSISKTSGDDGEPTSWAQDKQKPHVPQDGESSRWAEAQPSASRPRKGPKAAQADLLSEFSTNTAALLRAQPASSTKSAPSQNTTTTKSASKPSQQTPLSTNLSDSESEINEAPRTQNQKSNPIKFRQQDILLQYLGAPDDVEEEFEAEKKRVEDQDDDQVVDETLPGWGSWVGEGVSAKEKRRHQGRFVKTVEGNRKKEERRDRGVKGVIVNEKRVKKNTKYLASQLPHPYESMAQYERALRLPVGPEWVTKETHQNATKPKVLMKQGIVAPMLRPLH